MARQRKTEDEFRVHADYGQGWEEITATLTRKEARDHLKEYRANAGQFTYKMTGPHRVPKEGPANG